MSGRIAVFGGLLLDRYFKVDRWPARSQDGYVTDEQTFVGGCAVNMAVTAANLGGEACVVSAVGDDKAGIDILEYMHIHGLSGKYVYKSEGTTGSCLVFSEPDGERTFLTKKGVEGDFTDAMMEDICRDGCDVAAVTGYYLLNLDAFRVMECLKRLKSQGTKILFDPSPLVGDINKEYAAEIVNLADIITPNQTELELLGGDKIIPKLVQMGKVIVYKKGASGGQVYSQESNFEYNALTCEVVDTTGAGDSFAGALAWAFAEGLALKESIELAVKCSAKTVGVYGPHGFWRL